ncbi:MAG: hypothetical protein U5K56_20575 [Halioglobus sp.]|nr:hypothetical protein [Halioglobus sp.]
MLRRARHPEQKRQRRGEIIAAVRTLLLAAWRCSARALHPLSSIHWPR